MYCAVIGSSKSSLSEVAWTVMENLQGLKHHHLLSLGHLLIIPTTVKLIPMADWTHLCYTLSLLLPADVKMGLFSLFWQQSLQQPLWECLSHCPIGEWLYQAKQPGWALMLISQTARSTCTSLESYLCNLGSVKNFPYRENLHGLMEKTHPLWLAVFLFLSLFPGFSY